MEAGNVLRSDGHDLPIGTASGYGRLASLENDVKVFRPYKTFLKRSKRRVSPTGINFNTKLYFALLALKFRPAFVTILPTFKEKFSTRVSVIQDILHLVITVSTVFMNLLSNKISWVKQ